MSASVAPLVGRDMERRVFERVLETVDAGDARAVGVVGEPGIGKSRLLGELADRAAGRGHVVLVGRASELERDVPFALWGDAFGERVDSGVLEGMEDEQVAELAVALPALGVAPVVAERHRVARAVRVLLARLAAARPVTVLLDDVQWADPASADVVALLLHRQPDAPVLLTVAARAGRAPRLEAALATAARQGEAEVVELGPLPREQADVLMPGVGLSARARLYRESGGNPFYLEELVRAGSATAGGLPSVGAAGVPRAVAAALVGEIAALSARARLVAQGGAVVGDPFDPVLAAAAAGVGEAIALAALDELLEVDLVRPTEQPRRFRFRHPLVRRAVYESGGGGWRLAAHARAAEALAARGATAAERAHHVERAAHAGDLEAVELLALAAEETIWSAPATAAGWYEAAARLLPDGAEHVQRRLALLGARAGALLSAGRAAEACAVLRQVLDQLPAGATAERVETTVALAGLEAVWTQQPDEARRLLEAERDSFGDLAPGLRAELGLAMAELRAEYGDHAGSEALADRACAEARAAGDRALEASAAARAADSAHCRLRGDDPDALAAVDAKLAAAGALIEALPDDIAAQRLGMLVSLFVAHGSTGDFGACCAVADRGLVLARATGQHLFAPAFVCGRAFAALVEGRLHAAEADCEEVLESGWLSGNAQVTFWASLECSWIALARGEIDAALSHGHKAWELLGKREYSQAGYTVADARLAAGDPRGAAEALDAFGWVRPQLWSIDRLKATDVAVRVLLALGRVEEAATRARHAPLEGGGRRTGVFGAIIAHAEAAVLLAQGATSEAVRVALAGAAAARDAPAPLWGARCRIVAGEALLAGGRREDARSELRAAAAELEACGAWGYRGAALRVLRRLGDRPRAAASRPPHHGPLAALTAREREVAALVTEGQTNAQIAARLHLSESTVEKHVSRALAKLGLSSRAGVAGLVARER